MNTTNLTIHVADMICVTIEIGGRAAVTFSGLGFSSMSDVITAARREIGQFVGLVGLIVRNRTQGWNRRVALAAHRVAA